MIEEFSFDWYVEKGNKDPFFHYLTQSFLRADCFNLYLLSLSFPHISLCKKKYNHYDAPESPFEITDNVLRKEAKIPKEPCDYKTDCLDGAFNRYLFLSGGFVKQLSRTIIYADDKNIELIDNIYPQMVAAFKLDDWKMSPKGFKHRSYNSEKE